MIFRGADDGTVTPCSRRRELRHAEKDKRFQIRREQRFEWCQRPLGCSRGKAQQIGADLLEGDGGKKPSPVFAEIVVHLHRLLRAAFSQGDIGNARRGEEPAGRAADTDVPLQCAQDVDADACAIHGRMPVNQLMTIELVIDTGQGALNIGSDTFVSQHGY